MDLNFDSTLGFQKYNGRVDIMDNRCLSFPTWQENKSISNEPFKEQATEGIRTRTDLGDAFFSDENQRILQNELRYRVWLKTEKKYIIHDQSPAELQIIMRSTYFQYGLNLPYKIKEQVAELNERVLEYVVPNVYSNLLQYIGYKNDVSKLPVPLPQPVQVGMKGYKTLFMPNFM